MLVKNFPDLQPALSHMSRDNAVGEATIRFPDTRYAINLGFSDDIDLENNHFAAAFCSRLDYHDGQVRMVNRLCSMEARSDRYQDPVSRD